MEARQIEWDGIQLYAGLDLHKNKWTITVRTKTKHLITFTAPPIKEKLVETFFKKWPKAKIKAVYEAGCFGYHLSDYLNSVGIETIIVAPHRIPTEKGNFVKTDKIDSKKLANELSKDSLETIHLRSKVEIYERNLIRKRKQLVMRRRKILVRLKADIVFFNVQIMVTIKEYLSQKVIKVLRKLKYDDEFLSFSINQYLDEYETLKTNIEIIDNQIENLLNSKKHKRNYELLRSVPGIGKVTAGAILLEIGDINRFSNKEKFVSYLGLTPSEYSSGDKIRKGSISGMGHSYLRSLLVECAWLSIKKDPVLLKKFYHLSEKRGKLVAIVAIARKLAARIHYVLKTSQPYMVGVVK